MAQLTYDSDRFYIDGKPETIISGTIHYFRVPREYWRDRLEKLKQCGFNTVETYSCWNLHEKQPGKFDFTDNLDVAEYFRIAKDLGLNVIFRPGPFICAEWDFGGFPYWLHNLGCEFRCNDEKFLNACENYLKELISQIRPYLAENGGNVIMLQIENEYGSYGCDKEYLNALKDIYKKLGVGSKTVLFTSDGGADWMLSGGTIDGELAVVNFGIGGTHDLAHLKERRPDQPMMCGEYWAGWFTHWGEKMHVQDAKAAADDIDKILDMGGNLNVYMFHGGTSFGFMAGANYALNGEKDFGGVYQPDVTSYDYSAPLSENGDLTPEYFAIREVIEKHFGKLPELTVKNVEQAEYAPVEFTERADLFSQYKTVLKNHIHSPLPATFEDMGQQCGYIICDSEVKGPVEDTGLSFGKVHDRAHVYIDGKEAGVFQRSEKFEPVPVHAAAGEAAKVSVIVHSLGRINYGPNVGINDKKGIFRPVTATQRLLHTWDTYGLPIDGEQDSFAYENINPGDTFDTPAFYRGTLTVPGTPKDTFLSFPQFTEGCILVNGRNIGRIWDRGPQEKYYVPAPYLKSGDNEITIFALAKKA